MIDYEQINPYLAYIKIIEKYDKRVSKIDALKISIEMYKNENLGIISDNILDLCNQMLEIEQEISALRFAIKGEE